jgi:uncharacterized protein (TIGR02271 family)
MAKTVVGLFEDSSQAQAVVRDLGSAGFDRDHIHTDTSAGASAGGLMSTLTSSGVPASDARLYEAGVRQGYTLVRVRTDDEDADEAIAIFNRHNPIDLDTRASQWMAGSADVGASTATATSRSAAGMAGGMAAGSRNVEGQQAIPVVEEEISVGKREVQRGGVRVHTRVEERPVEEQVNLREEHVRVERRPVDRPVTANDLQTFQEGTIEMTERAEEAVVQKQARVVEEVVVGKEASQRTETVRDTVRRTDVDIQEIPTTGTRSDVDWNTYDADFRSNFQSSFQGGNLTYEQAQPAYRYGYSLGGSEWNEADARSQWEARNPGTWDRFKNAARYAYDRARAKTR